MKNLKTVITIIAISLSTIFSVTATDPIKKYDTTRFRTELSTLIGKKFPFKLEKTTHVDISFVLNNKNEVVVLSVDSNASELNTFLKGKLNYKKVIALGINKGKVYRMPIKINIK